MLAGLAVIAGMAAYIRREQRRVAVSGMLLGGVAVGFQLFTWSITMIAGALIIMGLMTALRGSFGDIFGGLTGE